MGDRTWTFLVAAALSITAIAVPDAAAQSGRGRGAGRPGPGGPPDRGDAATAVRPHTDTRVVTQKARTYQEPAFAAGYEDGHSRGMTDGSTGERYDPVRHAEYRDAERGYRESYGSRDAYRTNYRSGFRQGYEEGYRLGTRKGQ